MEADKGSRSTSSSQPLKYFDSFFLHLSLKGKTENMPPISDKLIFMLCYVSIIAFFETIQLLLGIQLKQSN